MEVDYEAIRQNNIARNEQFLKDLNLLNLKADITLLKPTVEQNISNITKKVKVKKKLIPKIDELDENSIVHKRRSNRLSKGAVENITLELDEDKISHKRQRIKEEFPLLDNFEIEESFPSDHKILEEDLIKMVEDCNIQHIEKIKPKDITHCVFRINTMTTSNLLTRLKKIRNPEKLIVFHYGLKLAQLDELADLAKQIACERKLW